MERVISAKLASSMPQDLTEDMLDLVAGGVSSATMSTPKTPPGFPTTTQPAPDDSGIDIPF